MTTPLAELQLPVFNAKKERSLFPARGKATSVGPFSEYAGVFCVCVWGFFFFFFFFFFLIFFFFFFFFGFL